MDLGLQGKIVVITGGTSGIGKAAALQFAKEGCKVAICGRNPQKQIDVKQEFSNLGFGLFMQVIEVSNYDAMSRFAEDIISEYGKIDVWINNAGFMPLKPVIDMDEIEWDSLFNVNLKSVFFGCKIAATKMKDQGGVILNASSYAAIIPSVNGGAYGASKAAILSLTRTLAAELAPWNIRVNAYLPGVTKTELTQEYIEAKGKQEITKQIALNRVGEPEDIGDVLVMLASDATRYITGASLEISGGKLCVQNPQTAWQ